MALIRCAECKSKISDRAIACPQCGAPIEISKKKHKRQIGTGCGCLIILVVVGGIVAAFVASHQNRGSRPASPAPTAEPGPKSTASVTQNSHKSEPEPMASDPEHATRPDPQPEIPVPQHARKPEPNPAPAIPQYSLVAIEDVGNPVVVRKAYRVRVPREMTKQELTAISEEIVRVATARQRINAITVFFYLPDSDTGGAFTAGKATWAPDGDWGKASTSLSPRLVVQAGSAMGSISEENVVNLPLEKKKQIFLQIVRYQDHGMDDERAYAVTAKQFGITTDQAKKIAAEGVVRGWPMP
ncbi:MAG: hypothetical protein WBD63_07675 [Phycisphaerae bacterium]|nr:hypothetical protein [Phycisphaerae bacterium]